MSEYSENTSSENEEVSIIAHLLEVEKKASQIIAAATVKSEKLISDAKIAADKKFREIYSERSAELQKTYEAKKSQIEENYNKIMDEYKISVQEKNQNKDQFSTLFEKLLFE